MKGSTLVSLGIFVFTLTITVYSWMDVISYRRNKRNQSAEATEGFANEGPNIISDKAINNIIKSNEPVPTDADAVQAHQTLLRYVRNDFSRGIRFVDDLGKRFYGNKIPLRPDLDVRKLMDNYQSPL